MQKFEYKVVEVRDLDGVNSTESFEAKLNEFGEEGWRLAPAPDPSLLILMRPKENGRSSVSDLLASEGYGA